MKTDKFQFTIGICAGYDHNNESDYKDIDVFSKLLNQCATEIENIYGIYVSFSIMPTYIVYKKEWGCPDEGYEIAYNLSAIRNPSFCNGYDNEIRWINACKDIAKLLKEKLCQSTVTCEFSETDILYFK